jgi:hypothetical protein
MVLADPGPLLTPPPSSSPQTTPIRSYSAKRLFQRHLRSLVLVWVWVWDCVHNTIPSHRMLLQVRSVTNSKNLFIGQYDKVFEEYWLSDIIAFTISGITDIIAIYILYIYFYDWRKQKMQKMYTKNNKTTKNPRNMHNQNLHH